MIKLKYPVFWQSSSSVISIILLPISWLYHMILLYRLLFSKPPIKFGCQTIAIGNINIGGTGKTQLALYLAQYYHSQNIKICIVTKGYGRRTNDTRLVMAVDQADDVGDEALMLSRYCSVLVYKNIHEADILIQQHGFKIAIFDDAMQNETFIKDATIVMIDGLRGFGNGRLLPAGPLRQYINQIKQDHIIILVGRDLLDISSQLPTKPLQANIVAVNEIDVNIRYYAFAGIGNPQKFYNSLYALQLNIIGTCDFADHHNYQLGDLEYLQNMADSLSCRLLTTEKDWIKLPLTYQSQIDYLKVTLAFHHSAEQQLFNLITQQLSKKVNEKLQ